MEPASKPSKGRGLIARTLLFGVVVLLLRFVYVVAIRGGSCTSGDFCFFSLPDELSLPGAGGIFRGAANVRFAEESVVSNELRRRWTSRVWPKAVEFYAAIFQDLVVQGFLSPTSKCLCIDTSLGQEVFALKEIGIADSVGISKNKSPPLVITGDALHLPFGNNTFDFIFAGRVLDQNLRLGHLAEEISRVLKSEGFLVLLTGSAGDRYSLHSLEALFPFCKKVRSREVDGIDSLKTLREIVFQKEELNLNVLHKGEEGENDAYPSSGGILVNNCPVSAHKLQLLRSAEPLIEEEPLKPWITLKRNVKDIKYLPSMVDISFKQRYVYIDVGARSYGSSIGSWFRKQYPMQNKTFDIYAIEADKAFHGEYASRKGITLIPMAAWIRNESLSFEVNHDLEKKGDEKGLGMGRIRRDSLSSGNLHTVQGFDLAEWLKSTVTEKDFVVMKMDVEGAEFDLVPRLFETGAICLIDELFLECHYNRWQRCCVGKRSPKYENTYGQCIHLFSSVRDSGVLVHQWW
ncbi:hypothetical protein AXF42_Ash004741 [Apostasia shenzhenica]|uniref:Uncharacterized protein n=1 Tax=Apostasia shenzhenica TaxID=1088818 RepID=A0A2I0BHI4_9ASPA|nr:hypothetical protein AXF42_Ash004741 [Apostasia shenzhenica]